MVVGETSRFHSSTSHLCGNGNKLKGLPELGDFQGRGKPGKATFL
jgi:hypothetical protein